jgi:hypothetical protein
MRPIGAPASVRFPLRHRLVPVAVFAALTGSPPAFTASRPELPPSDTPGMTKFLQRPAVFHAYSGGRRLEAAGSGQEAWLDAQTQFAPATGLEYQVTAEGGSSYIRSRVLRSLLDEEQRVIAEGEGYRVAVTEANYRFESRGVDAEGLAEIALTPLRKDRSLVKGRILVTPDGGDLVRLEGRLVKNPSFWVTRVDIVRRYARVNGVLMPVSLESAAQLRFLGRSTLRMTYHYSHVDGRPVID